MTPTTAASAQRWTGYIGYAVTVTPLLRWLLAHHTVPAGQPWRTRCDTCGAACWPGACTPSGRCRTCRVRIGAAPFLLEIAAATVLALLLWSGLRGWELAAYAWWATGMLVLAFIDAAVLRLPHRITSGTTVGTVLLLAFADAPGAVWWSAAISAVALTGFYATIHIVMHGNLGLGDVVLAIPIGIVVGWHDWRLAIIVVLVSHAAAVASIPIRRLTRTSAAHLPLGTHLAITSIVAVATTRN